MLLNSAVTAYQCHCRLMIAYLCTDILLYVIFDVRILTYQVLMVACAMIYVCYILSSFTLVPFDALLNSLLYFWKLLHVPL